MTDYEVLEILPTATMEEIHNAYIRQVKKYHPDKYSGTAFEALAADKIKRINLAYSRLKSIIPVNPCPKLKYQNSIYGAHAAASVKKYQ